jgi:hypothetical protein
MAIGEDPRLLPRAFVCQERKSRPVVVLLHPLGMPVPASPLYPPEPIRDPRITVGRQSYGLARKNFLLFQPWERVDIGSFCSFAADVALFGGGEHIVNVTSFPLLTKWIDPVGGHVEAGSKGPVRIGNDCWVGYRAIILSGVTVGDGAIVGAGAVVSRDVPPYAVVAGNPARVVGMRFDDATVRRLLAVAWWDWDDETIAARAHLFSDVEAFLGEAERSPPEAAARKPSASQSIPSPRGLYLDLLARGLVGLLARNSTPATSRGDGGVDVIPPMQPDDREAVRDWPADGYTMAGFRGLEILRTCVEDVLRRRVQGDFIEAGVWRGGAAMFMRGILAVHGVRSRRVWAADSFQGVPETDEEASPADAGNRGHAQPYLSVSEAEVRQNFARYDLLDDQVKFLTGDFRETLPAVKGQFAVIRLGSGSHESTSVALEHLYPRLNVGGYVIIDGVAWTACRQVVNDYRERRGIEEPVTGIDCTGAFWRKERTDPPK